MFVVFFIGSGSVANLALAVALARLFQTSTYAKYKYRIRFCWWGAEEIGLLGERLIDNLVNLNFDMLGSPNYVFGIYDGQTIRNATPANAIPGSNKITSLFRDWFNNQKLPWDNSTLGSGSDYVPFLAAGVAAGGLLSGASRIKTKEQCDRYALLLGSDPYCIPNIGQDSCYHKSCDTIWNINVFAYEKMVKAAAYVIESLALIDNLKEWLYPTKEIQRLKSRYGNKREYNSINEYFELPYL
jgi:Zn-dependent M28 family amino/carboxypeptidase